MKIVFYLLKPEKRTRGLIKIEQSMFFRKYSFEAVKNVLKFFIYITQTPNRIEELYFVKKSAPPPLHHILVVLQISKYPEFIKVPFRNLFVRMCVCTENVFAIISLKGSETEESNFIRHIWCTEEFIRFWWQSQKKQQYRSFRKRTSQKCLEQFFQIR